MIFKRVGAYLIDFLVITVVSSALTYISFINPKHEEYMKINEEYTELLDGYYEGEVKLEEFSEKTRELSYDMNKTGYVYVIGNIVITVLYFGVFQCITKGQTLGKKLLRIKVVSNKEGKELKLYNYLIRLVILNGVILNCLTLVAICFNRETYYSIYKVAANIDSILMIAIFVSVMLNVEGRGLHDIVAGTKVINLREKVVDEPSEFVKEAKIVENALAEEKEEVQEKIKEKSASSKGKVKKDGKKDE